jgi:hypothetical protein
VQAIDDDILQTLEIQLDQDTRREELVLQDGRRPRQGWKQAGRTGSSLDGRKCWECRGKERRLEGEAETQQWSNKLGNVCSRGQWLGQEQGAERGQRGVRMGAYGSGDSRGMQARDSQANDTEEWTQMEVTRGSQGVSVAGTGGF